MEDHQRIWIINDYILYALREVEPRPNFKVFGLVALAYYFDHRTGNQSYRFLFFIRVAAKDGDVRALE